MILQTLSKTKALLGTVGGLWLLTVPILASAAEIPFSNIFQVRSGGATGRQGAVDNLFNNRAFPIMVYGVSVAAILALVYAGYLYITAQGKPDQAEKGKRVAIYAILGLLLLGLVLIILTASRNAGAGAASNRVTEAL